MLSVNESSGENFSTLELHEIQATVLRQRPTPYLGTHLFLRVDDAQAGRAFLRRLTPHVDSAAGWSSAANAWLAVGITADPSPSDCGHTCHVAVKAKDHIFHPYEKR